MRLAVPPHTSRAVIAAGLMGLASLGLARSQPARPEAPAQPGRPASAPTTRPTSAPTTRPAATRPVAKANPSELTQADLLWRVVDLDRLTRPPPAGETSGLFSSGTRGGGPNAPRFMRRLGDGWDVWTEMNGPGVVTRLWCAAPAGVVRITLDGKAVIESPLSDLFGGGVEPFGAPFSYQTADGGGCDLYFPIGYARSCQIATRGFQGPYEVSYTTLPAATRVETFRPQLDAAARAALSEVASVLEKGLSDAQIFEGRSMMTLASQSDPPLEPGGKLTETLDKAGTVRALYLGVTDKHEPADLYALRHVLLRVWFDGEKNPAVEAPLSDFFGSGFDREPFASLPMGTVRWVSIPGLTPQASWFNYCFFPMPFSNGLKIELENQTRRKITLMLYARIERAAPPPDSLRFNARFRRENPCKGPDFALLAASGPGRVVGCTLAVDSPRQDGWGGGRLKGWLDADGAPALCGADTAAFLGDAPPLRNFIRPLHGALRSGPYGKTAAYRWLIGDSIDFHKTIRLALEAGPPAGAADVDYAAVVYWYAPAGAAATNFRKLRSEELTPAGLRIPGAVEIEGRVAGDNWGRDVTDKFETGVEYSGGSAASISSDAPVRVTLSWPRKERVRLALRVNPRRSFEAIQVSDAAGGELARLEYRRAAEGVYEVGEVELASGENVFVLRCPKPVVLDCWIVTPVK